MCDRYPYHFSLQLGNDSCGCCLRSRRFITSEEKVKALECYKKELQREIVAIEETIKKLRPVEEVEV